MTSPCWEKGREGTRKTLRFLKPMKNCRQPKRPPLGPWFVSYSTSIGCPSFLEGLRLLSYKTATKPPSHWLTARMQSHIIHEQSSACCRTVRAQEMGAIIISLWDPRKAKNDADLHWPLQKAPASYVCWALKMWAVRAEMCCKINGENLIWTT